MRRSFDLLASAYRWMEFATFGRSLQECRYYYLHAFGHVQRALLLGDGDGRFTGRLLATAPQATAVAVDSSPAMLAQVHTRCRALGCERRLSSHQADLREGLPEAIARQKYDFVATHFFLDCLSDEDVLRIVQQVVPLLTAEAAWVVSEFNVPDSVLRVPAQVLVRLLYFAFYLLTGLQTQRLPKYRQALNDCGMHQQHSRQFLHGILIAELWVPGPRSEAETPVR